MSDIYCDRPPLWQVMQDAYFKGGKPGFSETCAYAAELRAIADWLVPPDRDNDVAPFAIRFTTLRAVFLSEADKAEASEP
jgi:hypothetical protein